MNAAAEALFAQFQPLVLAAARSVSASCPDSIELEDLQQVGNLALANACQNLDPDRAVTFAAYARMRVRGAMLDHLRSQYREATRERDAVRIDAKPIAAFRIGPCETEDPAIARAIGELPPRQALVISMRFREELTRPEAARRLGVTASTVARDEHAALQQLRAKFAKAA